MPLSKEYTSNNCVVTFTFERNLSARTVHLVAEFNEWDRETLRMQKIDGAWQLTITLEPDTTYQYRYLVNGAEWFNDTEADDYVAHPYGGENSVVET